MNNHENIPRGINLGAGAEFRFLRRDQVQPDPENPRKRFDESKLQELADSIRANGILQPCVVRSVGASYWLIAGERRWRAAGIAEVTEIPCLIRTDLTPEQVREMMLLENIQREDLDPVEEARAMAALLELGYTQAQVGERIGRSQNYVSDRVKLLQLPEPALAAVAERKLSPSAAEALRRFSAFPEIQAKIAELAAERHTPVKELATGLPFTAELQQSQLVLGFWSGNAPIDVKQHCEQCPHQAHLKIGEYTHYCLRPAHFRELAAAAEAERKAQTQAVLTKAKAEGKELPKLSELKYGTYESLGNHRPAGCSAQCPCAGQALSFNGTTVSICTDPKRLQSLRLAEGKAQKKALREQYAVLLAELDRREAEPDLYARMVAVVVREAIGSVSVAGRREVAPRFADTAPEFANWLSKQSFEYTRGPDLEVLIRTGLGVETLIRAVAQSLVRSYVAAAIDNKWAKVELLDFLLGRGRQPAPQPQPELEPGPECAECGTLLTAETPGRVVDVVFDGEAQRAVVVCGRCYFGTESGVPVCTRCDVDLPADACHGEECEKLPNGIIVDPRGHMLTPQDAFYCRTCRPDVATCRECGCTDEAGCPEGCSWTQTDLCSVCAGQLKLPEADAEKRPERCDRCAAKLDATARRHNGDWLCRLCWTDRATNLEAPRGPICADCRQPMDAGTPDGLTITERGYQCEDCTPQGLCSACYTPTPRQLRPGANTTLCDGCYERFVVQRPAEVA